MKSSRAICVAGLCLLASVSLIHAGTNVVTRAVTARHASFPASVTAAGGSVYPILTPDGRYVAFMSNAGNLVTNDNNGADFDIFVRDRINRTTVLVSVDASGKGGGNGLSTLGGISADGRYVVFESEASNLVMGDTNRQGDVFIRDLQLGVTRLVSVTTNGVQGRWPSQTPVMTPDGSRVLFSTASQELAPEARSFGWSLVLWDRSNGGLQSMAQPLTSSPFPDSGAFSPTISADGRLVAYVSESTNLVAGMPFQHSQVFVRDVAAGRTSWVSEKAMKLLAPAQVTFYEANLSQDGRALVFFGQGYGQRGAWLLFHDFGADTTTLIAHQDVSVADLSLSSMTPDGSLIAYQMGGQCYLWRAADATTTLLTSNQQGTGPANGRSQNAVIADDGRYVFFTSDASDLVAEPVGAGFQLYRRDLLAGLTVCLSTHPDGSPGEDLNEVLPSISADGRWVAFESTDTGLAAGDDNDASDVFVRDTEAGHVSPFLGPELVSSRDLTLDSLTSGNWTTGVRNQFPTRYANRAFDREGRKLIFTTDSTDLTAGNGGGKLAVYTHDVATGSNSLAAAEIVDYPGDYGITADGTKVYFYAPEPVSSTNREKTFTGVMLDLASGKRQITAVSSKGESLSLSGYRYLVSSADGRYVTYTTPPSYRDRVWRDLATPGLPKYVNVGFSSDSHDISPGGHRVVHGFKVLSIWDARTGLDREITPLYQYLYESRFSANGDFIICRAAPREGPGSLYGGHFVYSVPQGRIVFWLLNKKNPTPFQPSWVTTPPVLSANGRFFAFGDDADGRLSNDANGKPDIYVCDLVRGTTNLVSINWQGTRSGNGISTCPSISDDGRFVAFLSTATDLTPDPVSGKRQVFVRDIWLNRTFLVSQNYERNGGGNADSVALALSPTGRHVAYLTTASNLLPGDFNFHQDIYLAELPEVPLVDEDGDGMDDVWERYFFGNLERDGKGDLDGDGYSDLEEYLLKLDPVNPTIIDMDEDGLDDHWERKFFASLDRDGTGDFDRDGITDADEFRFGTSPLVSNALEILEARWNDNRTLRITWRAIPGARYQVQYKLSLSQINWLNVPAVVTATANEASYVDAAAATVARRFYRVMKFPQ